MNEKQFELLIERLDMIRNCIIDVEIVALGVQQRLKQTREPLFKLLKTFEEKEVTHGTF